MKPNANFSKTLIYGTLSFLALVIAWYLGPIIYQHETLTKGLLGAANLIFIYILFFSQNSPLGIRLLKKEIRLPNDIVDIFIVFILSLLAYWSTKFVINAINSLVK